MSFSSSTPQSSHSRSSRHRLMPSLHARLPPPALVDHHPATYPPNAAMQSPPGDDLCPPHTHQLHAHLTTQPALYHQAISVTLPSAHTHQPERSTHQDRSFNEHPTHRVQRHLYPDSYFSAPAMTIPHPQQPPHLAQTPFPQGTYRSPHPATLPGRPVSYPPYLPPGFQSHIHPQSSVTYPPPEYSVNQVHRQSLWKPQGMVLSTSPGPEQLHHHHYQNQGMFNRSHDLVFSDSTFIDFNDNRTITDNFMKDFLQHTIIGAEYDSSDRDPPPRCHPGTRLAILARCKAFIVECDGEEKMRWVVGPAGAGKSAVMQMVAEETPADASVFLSVNGRHDGAKTFTTIAYQLAAKYKSYKQFIQNEISGDPSLLRKALSVQFQKFIADPFIHRQVFDRSRRFVIIIDGLDECDNPLVQQQLLELISRFCISSPTSPVVWFITSRPEPHITSFFEKVGVQPAYTKEEIVIDSDEACADVQRYFRDELKGIKLAYPTLTHRREWPSELEFTKIATAAGGLFAYASTVIRYINDPYYGDPVSQLDDVLAAIDKGLNDEASRKNNPLALLDALYDKIISKIPDSSVANARKILFFHSDELMFPYGFRTQCNRLGLTEDAAYAAVRHLHALVKVPAPDKADDGVLAFYHKSFKDFLIDPLRSGFCSGLGDLDMFQALSSLRIIKQVPTNFDRMALGESIRCSNFGLLKASASICNDISLSWPGDERFSTTDQELRRELYTVAMVNICTDFRHKHNFLRKISSFDDLTTRFTSLGFDFPLKPVMDFAFDNIRTDLMVLGKLQQVPARSLDYAAICTYIEIQLACPDGMSNSLWSQSYFHWHESETLEDGHDSQGRWCRRNSFLRWQKHPDDTTQPDIPRFYTEAIKDRHRQFRPFYSLGTCFECSQRFARQLINNPDTLATVFVDATEMSYVEWSFVDPDDGVSEWRYRFRHSGLPSTLIDT